MPEMIPIESVEHVAGEIMRRASIEIPRDYRDGVEAMVEEETSELRRFVLRSMF